MGTLLTRPDWCEGHCHLGLTTARNGKRMAQVGELTGCFVWNAALLLRARFLPSVPSGSDTLSLHLLTTMCAFSSPPEALEVGWHLVFWPNLPSSASVLVTVVKARGLSTKPTTCQVPSQTNCWLRDWGTEVLPLFCSTGSEGTGPPALPVLTSDLPTSTKGQQFQLSAYINLENRIYKCKRLNLHRFP